MARRGRGEGSIYQRKDGLWCAQVDLGWAGGKRKRKYLYGKTRRAVAEQMKAIHHEQQQGLPVPTGRQTVAQYLDRWLHGTAKHNLERAPSSSTVGGSASTSHRTLAACR